jgi:hypothetical protein
MSQWGVIKCPACGLKHEASESHICKKMLEPVHNMDGEHPFGPSTRLEVDENGDLFIKHDTDLVLAERGSRYGKFIDNAKFCQEVKRLIRESGGPELPPLQAEALELIALKISRIVTGDPNYVDNWVDVAGYAELVVKELSGEGI